MREREREKRSESQSHFNIYLFRFYFLPAKKETSSDGNTKVNFSKWRENERKTYDACAYKEEEDEKFVCVRKEKKSLLGK